MEAQNSLHWDIHPSVVLQLGEDLITDVVQALVELVKNSYDADATYAKVIIRTDKNDIPGSMYPDAEGSIVIDDDGCGMDPQTIQRGWLTISNSLKREMKASKRTTRLGRTPLGDKGLGRLGAQRLGSNLEIITRPDGSSTGYHIGCSWQDFERQGLLSTIPVERVDIPDIGRKGTRVIISGLRNTELWKRNAVDTLKDQLSLMISPYKDVRDFHVIVIVNGRSLELADIPDRIRDSAQLRYWIDYRDQKLSVLGKVGFTYLHPGNRRENELFREMIQADGGAGFLEFLAGQPSARGLAMARSYDGKWFVEFRQDRVLSDLDSVSFADGTLADPGPFRGEVDSFDLGKSAETQGVFDKATEYRRYIKSLSGIRVYRDGFAIRVDKDWLKLGESWTSGPSYYGLKPNNTIGYLALSARDNSVLEETTDREGFKATPYYENFYRLLQHFVQITQQAQESLRRSALAYVRSQSRGDAGVSEAAGPEEIAREINVGLSKGKEIQGLLQALDATLSQAADIAHDELSEANGLPADHATHSQASQSTVSDLVAHIDEARSAIRRIQEYPRETEHLWKLSSVMRDQIDQLREQLDQMYETVSLGLTAEALSHEIHSTADRLALLTRQVTEHLRQSGSADSKVLAFIEHVKSGVSAMRKQLSHLAPSLQYVREERVTIDLPLFFAEMAEYYEDRLRDEKIQLFIENSGPFNLVLNKGKLTQIIDNLVLNSEYWLREDLRTGRIRQGRISIEIRKPYVRISDNGRGIDRSVEESLFEPFVTTKGRGKGRGLGLFIVRQLLDSEGCTISLLQTRNEQGHRYIFEIDLSGGIDGRGG